MLEHEDVHTRALHAELRADVTRWNALPLVGFQQSGEEHDPNVDVELRHCTCGSTLGRRVSQKDTMNTKEETPPSEASAAPEGRSQLQTRPTVRLDPRDLKPSWPIAIASLEQLSDWAVLALRLGTLALIQSCVRDLAVPEARADLIVRLRALTDALAHMPLEA